MSYSLLFLCCSQIVNKVNKKDTLTAIKIECQRLGIGFGGITEVSLNNFYNSLYMEAFQK